jgi:CCR4-NOT transcription complex subunit 4
VPNATVTTSVLGVQRTVNVQLPHTSIEPYPEAASTLTNLNQGMRAGTITSKEAAAQLVALLKMREVQNGKVPQGPKAPPGFAAPITPPPGFGGSGGFGSAISVAGGSGGQQQGASSQFFSPNDQPVTVTPPALGRYQPIGTRTSAVGAGGLGGLQDTHGVSDGLGNGSSLQGNGTTNGGASYSMWGGLPGLGGGLGGASTSYNPLIGVLGSSQWSTQAGGASGMWSWYTLVIDVTADDLM